MSRSSISIKKHSNILNVGSHVTQVKVYMIRACGLKWPMTGNLLANGRDDIIVYISEASRMNSAHFLHHFTNQVATIKALTR